MFRNLQSRALRTRDLLVRARKRLHPRQYWQSLAKDHPINGLTLAQLRLELEVARRSSRGKAELVALPGLLITSGKAYYNGFPLGHVASALETSFHQLYRGKVPDDASGLIKAGFAFRTANSEGTRAKRVLILSPHRDDAALSIGGIMHKRACEHSFIVCNVFTICAWLGKGFHQSTAHRVSRIRYDEELLSNRILGSTSVGLDLWDAEVRNYHRRAVDKFPTHEGFVFAKNPHLRTLGEQDSIRRSILELVDLINPSEVFFPLGLGSHHDHTNLRDHGVSLSQEIQRHKTDCQIYFYEDQPYATYDEVDPGEAVSDLEAMIALSPETVDITDSFEAKIQAIAAHRSQFRRDENEERLKHYASVIATQGTTQANRLAERIWRLG